MGSWAEALKEMGGIFVPPSLQPMGTLSLKGQAFPADRKQARVCSSEHVPSVLAGLNVPQGQTEGQFWSVHAVHMKVTLGCSGAIQDPLFDSPVMLEYMRASLMLV